MRKLKGHRVEVVWRDSLLDNGGWEPIHAHLHPRWGSPIHSIGYVLKHDRKGITLASSVHDDKAAGVVHIPAGCVIEITRFVPR